MFTFNVVRDAENTILITGTFHKDELIPLTKKLVGLPTYYNW